MGLFDAIGGGIGGIVEGVTNLIPGVVSGKRAQKEYQQQMSDLLGRIDKEWSLPTYDQTPLTQKEYTLLNMFAPQVAGFIQQQAPQLLSNVKNKGVQAQEEALDKYQQLSGTGVDSATQAQYDLANYEADQAMRSNRANALQSLAQQGLASSGATLNADIGAGIAAADQQRRANLEAAAQAGQRRLQAIQGLGNLGSQVAGQKQQAEEFNANTLNRYNELLANRQQQYQNYLADTQNQANLYNQQQTQRVGDMNTALGNQTNLMNRQRQDQMEAAMTNAKNDKLRLLAGQEREMAGQRLNYAQNQSQNLTGAFLSLAGLGVGAAMGGLPGAALGGLAGSSLGKAGGGGPMYQPSPQGSYGNVNPNYGLGVDYSPIQKEGGVW